MISLNTVFKYILTKKGYYIVYGRMECIKQFLTIEEKRRKKSQNSITYKIWLGFPGCTRMIKYIVRRVSNCIRIMHSVNTGINSDKNGRRDFPGIPVFQAIS